jgi:type IV pilus assembly protein PilP
LHGDDLRADRTEEADDRARCAWRGGCAEGGIAMTISIRLTSFATAVLFASTLGVSAQGKSPASAPASTPAPAAPAPVTTPAPPAPVGPELEPQGYTYDPHGRRDPFVSLLRRGSDVQRSTLGVRPAGLAGLETSEVTLKGTVATQGTYVGIVQGSDGKTYIVKAGDKLLDGTIRTINPDSMVISQQVNDPLSLDKQREVRKVLRQTEEGK